MKTYKSHKIVEAAKIVAADMHMSTGVAILTFDDASVETVDCKWLNKNGAPHQLIGGYFVRYPGDGYTSWSPAEAFEEGYTLHDEDDRRSGMNFGAALALLKAGKLVAREGWNGKGMFLYLVPGSTFNVNRAPLLGIYEAGTEIRYHAHIDMKTADGQCVPWLASQTDMLAEDWEVV